MLLSLLCYLSFELSLKVFMHSRPHTYCCAMHCWFCCLFLSLLGESCLLYLLYFSLFCEISICFLSLVCVYLKESNVNLGLIVLKRNIRIVCLFCREFTVYQYFFSKVLMLYAWLILKFLTKTFHCSKRILKPRGSLSISSGVVFTCQKERLSLSEKWSHTFGDPKTQREGV